MTRRNAQGFATIRTEGGLLSSDLLQRIAAEREEGVTPDSYHLGAGETLKDSISRSWSRLLAVWKSFRQALEKTTQDDPATTLTRDKWLLPLFHELGYGRLPTARGLSAKEKDYAISHLSGTVPIHLLGARVDLERRSQGIAGAAKSSPHGLVQEFLNSSDDHLWGIVSNGLRLRVLRDYSSLTRQAYVEFDLEAMMAGEAYADFAVLWLLCHQSRFEGEDPNPCRIEAWSRSGAAQGVRALERLRDGVTKAIESLGQGFLAYPTNTALKEALRSGQLDKQEYYRELLRLVYRLIFLFVAEDRDLLHRRDASPEARKLYREHYSTGHLRELARTLRGTRHPDRWRLLRYVCGMLDEQGCDALGLPPLGGFLWSNEACPHLDASDVSNAHLLEAIRRLGFVQDGTVLHAVDWKNLGPEELGSIYESLLELHPVLHAEAGTFDLSTAAGNERKTTGSYYTPTSLIHCLLDTALDPVLDDAAKKPEPEKAILALKVCDPACGSGHFLIAAAYRIARKLASIRTGDEEPSPEAYRAALRDVIGHCVYGVDVNTMAVELCKVNLWLESIDPGKALSFLDHHIRCGNSLLGTTPALIAKGIPDEAFEVLEGDDKAVTRELKKRNRQERQAKQGMMYEAFAAELERPFPNLSSAMAGVDAADAASVQAQKERRRRFLEFERSPEFQHAKLVADAWTAAFVWRKVAKAPDAVTHLTFRALRQDPTRVAQPTREEVARLAEEYSFLHWHLAFPGVFEVSAGQATVENEGAGWNGGFDVVLGNPPWEHTELKEQEWFATRSSAIAAAPTGAARKQMIEGLALSDPELLARFLGARRLHGAVAFLISAGGRYPLCGRGRINTYTIFSELVRSVINLRGRVGCIVPSGLATDDTTKFFFQDLLDSRSLVSLFDFVNDVGLFPGVGHGRFKFCLLTLCGKGQGSVIGAFVAFHLSRVEELRLTDRQFILDAADTLLLNPNTRTCPIFRTRRDAEITKAIYRRVPVLVREGPPEDNPWGISFMQGLFNMTSASGLFKTRGDLQSAGWQLHGSAFERDGGRFLPLYEAKMIHHYDHRYGDYSDRAADSENTSLPDVPETRLADPNYSPLPRYWVPTEVVDARLADRWTLPFLLCCRKITNATNERTVIASIVPRIGVGDSLSLMLLPSEHALLAGALIANLSSFVLDYAARQKVGGTNLNFFLYQQFPVMPPSAYTDRCPWSSGETVESWMMPRILELVYTTHDLTPFAHVCGFNGPPFRWDTERRFQLRCELDAAFFHLYGISHDEAAYIMDTFPIVRRNDEVKYGVYRTKEVVLESLQAMSTSLLGVR